MNQVLLHLLHHQEEVSVEASLVAEVEAGGGGRRRRTLKTRENERKNKEKQEK